MFKLSDNIPINGLLVFETKSFTDERGYFFESYQVDKFRTLGLNENFVQDNVSNSKKNVIRGLHYQREPFAQGKLVTVLKGRVLDVAVDIRRDSKTFGQSFSIELSETNKKIFWIPIGFAHGFSVLSEECIFLYKCTNFYDKSSEGGIRFDDPQLSINWMIDSGSEIVSEKDLELPFLNSGF